MQYIIEEYVMNERWRADLYDINEINRLEFGQEPASEHYFRWTFLRNPMLIFVVARLPETKRIIGKWSWYILPLDRGGDKQIKGWAEQVAVHTHYQDKGIGKALWKEAHRLARRRKCGFAGLSSAKEPAQNFYKRVGWEARPSTLFTFTFSDE